MPENKKPDKNETSEQKKYSRRNLLVSSSTVQPPGQDFILGTDHLGRDVFSQWLYGSRPGDRDADFVGPMVVGHRDGDSTDETGIGRLADGKK